MRRGYVPNFKLAFLDLVLAFMANLEFSETNLGGRGGQVRPIEPAQPVDSGKRIVSQTSLDLFDKSSSGQGKRKKYDGSAGTPDSYIDIIAVRLYSGAEFA
jgi:hypothetical protein